MSVIASNTSGATTGPDPASLARERREPSSICLHTMTWLLGMLWVRSVAHLLVTRYAELRRATLKRSNGDGSAKWFLCGRDYLGEFVHYTPASSGRGVQEEAPRSLPVNSPRRLTGSPPPVHRRLVPLGEYACRTSSTAAASSSGRPRPVA